jgi:hypothetical protein
MMIYHNVNSYGIKKSIENYDDRYVTNKSWLAFPLVIMHTYMLPTSAGGRVGGAIIAAVASDSPPPRPPPPLRRADST